MDGVPLSKVKSDATYASVTPRAMMIHKQRGDDVQPGTNAVVKGTTCAEIKKELLAQKAFFEDPDFPANNSSISYSGNNRRQLVWKRPREICSDPEFIVGGTSRFDVQQGELGDCWLLAAVATLSLQPELFEKVVPADQSFKTGDYAGIFRFQFWQFGEWVEVVVDDRLPTYNGQLVYMSSVDKNEFWSALLEKAYAKMCGSYEALVGGSQGDALEDFTGGIMETFELKEKAPKNLLDIMLKAFARSSLMGCSINGDPNEVEAKLTNGLIMGHAYSVTAVKMVDINVPGKTGKIPLVRCRNPWGNEAEWKGAWGDKSSEWQYISEASKQALGLSFENDGEFWMSYPDFIKNFEKLEICYLGPQSMSGEELKGSSKRRWEMCVETGAWKRKLNAGGCRNYLNTFWTNPQFRVNVVDPDEEDDDNQGTIIIGLLQKNMRRRKKEGLDNYAIGYLIYKLENPPPGPLDVNFFKRNASIAKSPAFINSREVCGRHKLAPGSYVIVPSTFEPDQEAEFMLRMFSEKPNESNEVDQETDLKEAAPAPEIKPERLDALITSFKAIAGEDMEIDAHELRNILDTTFKKEFKFDGFSIETCRSLIALMDVDQSGKLGFDEFKTLWQDLRLWKIAFKKYDADQSGNFNSYELRQALGAVGYSVSNSVFNSLVMRYSSREGVIFFDDFILICARLKIIFETFKAQKKLPSGEAVFNKDVFMQSVLYS
jgi:calpain, invertebrate